jgi:hypothetical protein
MRPATLALAVVMAGGAQAQNKGVEIVRDGAAYRLIRNGQPYFIRGAAGCMFPERLAAAGGNSMRAGAGALDRAGRLGLTVLAELPLGKPRLGFNYSARQQVERQEATLREIVLKHKGQPALLMWALGDELEVGTTAAERAPMWQEVNRLAEMIHRIDGGHPVITIVGDAYRRILAEIDQYCPALDAVGLDSYVDMLTVPQDLEKQGWRRPYVVTQFGPRAPWQVARTSWKVPLEDTSTEKADFYQRAYLKAVEGVPQCLGSYVFEWGYHNEKTPTWYGMFLPDGSATGAVEVMTFLWKGVWPANRSPRIGHGGIRVRQVGASDPAERIYSRGTRLLCEVDASDPGGDAVSFSWEVRPDVADNPTVSGDREEAAAPIADAIVSSDRNHAMIRLPDKPGNYRIFVYVLDGKGAAATANVPVKAN